MKSKCLCFNVLFISLSIFPAMAQERQVEMTTKQSPVSNSAASMEKISDGLPGILKENAGQAQEIPTNEKQKTTKSVKKLKEKRATKGKKIENIQLLLKQGEIDKVITILESTEYQNRTWKTYFWLGTAYLINGQHNAAAQALDSALALKSDGVEIWVQRATVEQERNNLVAAVQLLQVAIQLDPKYAKAYLNLAYAYEALKKPKRARTAYGYYLKFADGKSVQDIRLKQKILSNIVNKTS